MAKVEIKGDNGAAGTKTISMDLPSNSHKSKKEPKKKVNKVISGNVTRQKKSLGRKFTETFIGQDVVDVKSYLLNDIAIPAIKDFIYDTVTGGISMTLFGDARSRGSKTPSQGGSVPYASYYGSKNQQRKSPSRQNQVGHNFDDIKFQTRNDANAVIDGLDNLIYEYGQATIADMYDMVGVTSSFTDHKWGWTNISRASIKHSRDGYIINFPQAEVLS